MSVLPTCTTVLKHGEFKLSYYIKKLFPSVRGLFAPTGHSFQNTDIWFSSYDPKIWGTGAFAIKKAIGGKRKWNYQNIQI